MASNYLDIIKLFVGGKISLKELSDYIDDRLFELRQDPDSMSEEQSILSEIELLICEIKDGFRDITELEEFTRTLIAPKPIVRNWDGSETINSVISSSSNRDVIQSSDPMLQLRQVVFA